MTGSRWGHILTLGSMLLVTSLCEVADAQTTTREDPPVPPGPPAVPVPLLGVKFDRDGRITADDRTGFILVRRPRRCRDDADLACLPALRLLFDPLGDEWKGADTLGIVLVDSTGNPVAVAPTSDRIYHWVIQPHPLSVRLFVPNWRKARPPVRLRGPYQLRFLLADGRTAAESDPFEFVPE